MAPLDVLYYGLTAGFPSFTAAVAVSTAIYGICVLLRGYRPK